MDRADIIQYAEMCISYFRDLLCLDPFYRIKVEVVEGEFISMCEVDKNSAASWVIKINPKSNKDEDDIKSSVLDGLIRILFRYIPSSSESEEVISRLITAFMRALSSSDDNEENLNEEVQDEL